MNALYGKVTDKNNKARKKYQEAGKGGGMWVELGEDVWDLGRRCRDLGRLRGDVSMEIRGSTTRPPHAPHLSSP